MQHRTFELLTISPEDIDTGEWARQIQSVEQAGHVIRRVFVHPELFGALEGSDYNKTHKVLERSEIETPDVEISVTCGCYGCSQIEPAKLVKALVLGHFTRHMSLRISPFIWASYALNTGEIKVQLY